MSASGAPSAQADEPGEPAPRPRAPGLCLPTWSGSSSARPTYSGSSSRPSRRVATSCSRTCPAPRRRCSRAPSREHRGREAVRTAVHPRPAADRRDGTLGLQSRSRADSSSDRARFRERRPGRRDQPRTAEAQSALLEAMAERQVTVDGVTRPLPAPFFVIATENPIELDGTFPLPEAQLDRFLVRASLGYPGLDEEIRIVEGQVHGHPLDGLRPSSRGTSWRSCSRGRARVRRPLLRGWIVESCARRVSRGAGGGRLCPWQPRARSHGARRRSRRWSWIRDPGRRRAAVRARTRPSLRPERRDAREQRHEVGASSADPSPVSRASAAAGATLDARE